jgi:glycosyltransferase involved in cell wall biosynthesis
VAGRRETARHCALICRVLYIQYTNPAGYPPLEHSSRILADRAWEVLFLGTGAHGADALEIPLHANIEVRRWKFVRAGLRQKLHFFAFNVWVLVTAVRWKPKWIYASDILACPAAFVLKRLGFRVLYHEHDSPAGADTPSSQLLSEPSAHPSQRPAPSFFQRFLLWSRTKLARRADLCVLPNEKRAALFTEQTETSCPVICVWNCASREEAAVQSTKPSDEFVVFYHGSLVPSRLPLQVIDALAQLPESIRFEFAGYKTVGHPDFVSELLKRATRNGISDRVRYFGVAPRRDALLAACRRAHVGLALMPLTSSDTNEQTMLGASNKPFDYFACELALLVSDLPDWNEMFVKPAYARACNPEDPESIATALRWFVEHPNETRAMGEHGRQRVLQEWNYEKQFEPVLCALESA